jgi:hypothetical protein
MNQNDVFKAILSSLSSVELSLPALSFPICQPPQLRGTLVTSLFKELKTRVSEEFSMHSCGLVSPTAKAFTGSSWPAG